MNTYGTLYTSSFKCLNGDSYNVWIEKKDYTGNSTTITLASAPVIVYDKIKKEYDFLFSSGIELSLLSTTDRKFLNLYTNEIQQYRIQLYKNNYYSGGYFLDTETYSEDFNQINNYNVNITANDGLKILERYNYVDDSSNKFSGITSLWNVFTTCMKKVSFATPFLYANINTTISGVTNSTSQTTLHNTYVKQENFYDESEEPMNCLEVIESILTTYQLYLFQDYLNGRFYLIDKVTLSNSSNVYKIYDMQSYSYQSQTTISTNAVDISTIKMASDTSTLEIVPALNSQKVNYSQYATDIVFDWTASNKDFTGTTNTVRYSTSDTNYKWNELQYSASNTWNKISSVIMYPSITPINCVSGYTFTQYQGAGAVNTGTTDYYFCEKKGYFGEWDIAEVLTLKKSLDWTNWSSGKYRLRIEMNAYFRTKNTPDNPDESSQTINTGNIALIIRCGQYQTYWDGEVFSWQEKNYADSLNDIVNIKFYNSSDTSVPVGDQWLDNCVRPSNRKADLNYNFNIPMATFLTDRIQVIVTNHVFALLENEYDATTATARLKDVRIKSIKLSVVDEAGNTIDTSDILYNSMFDEKNKSAGSEIKHILGTNIKKLPIAKGSLMYYKTNHYEYIQNWIFSGSTNCIEKLKLETILNNYYNPTYSLSCTTNIFNSLLSVVTYNNYISNYKFMITGLQVSLEDSSAKLNLNKL